MSKRIYISVDKNGRGSLQLAIGDEGSSGYRIAGPKYDGTGGTVFKHYLSERDSEEIRRYLDMMGDK